MDDTLNITAAQYIQSSRTSQNISIKATINGEEMFVPISVGNREYDAIKAKHDDADDSFTIQDAS